MSCWQNLTVILSYWNSMLFILNSSYEFQMLKKERYTYICWGRNLCSTCMNKVLNQFFMLVVMLHYFLPQVTLQQWHGSSITTLFRQVEKCHINFGTLIKKYFPVKVQVMRWTHDCYRLLRLEGPPCMLTSLFPGTGSWANKKEKGCVMLWMRMLSTPSHIIELLVSS